MVREWDQWWHNILALNVSYRYSFLVFVSLPLGEVRFQGSHHCEHDKPSRVFPFTVIILNIGTDRSEQTVQTQIRLLLMEQSDQGLLCLLFCLHLLNTIRHCKIQLFQL